MLPKSASAIPSEVVRFPGASLLPSHPFPPDFIDEKPVDDLVDGSSDLRLPHPVNLAENPKVVLMHMDKFRIRPTPVELLALSSSRHDSPLPFPALAESPGESSPRPSALESAIRPPDRFAICGKPPFSPSDSSLFQQFQRSLLTPIANSFRFLAEKN